MKKVLLFIALVAFAFTGCKKESTSDKVKATINGSTKSFNNVRVENATIFAYSGSIPSVEFFTFDLNGLTAGTTYNVQTTNVGGFSYYNANGTYDASTGTIKYTSLDPINATFSGYVKNTTNPSDSLSVTNGVINGVK